MGGGWGALEKGGGACAGSLFLVFFHLLRCCPLLQSHQIKSSVLLCVQANSKICPHCQTLHSFFCFSMEDKFLKKIVLRIRFFQEEKKGARVQEGKGDRERERQRRP